MALHMIKLCVGADTVEDLLSELFGDVPPELARQLREVGAW